MSAEFLIGMPPSTVHRMCARPSKCGEIALVDEPNARWNHDGTASTGKEGGRAVSAHARIATLPQVSFAQTLLGKIVLLTVFGLGLHYFVPDGPLLLTLMLLVAPIDFGNTRFDQQQIDSINAICALSSKLPLEAEIKGKEALTTKKLDC